MIWCPAYRFGITLNTTILRFARTITFLSRMYNWRYGNLNREKSVKGPSIKYFTLFLVNFYPLLCYTLPHIPGPSESTSHISDPPIFSRPSTKIPDKSPLYKFYLNWSRRFLSGRFCPSWFLFIPPSVTIHLLQQKVKHHFKFHVSYV